MHEKKIAVEAVAMKILIIRGRKVMLDRDLAQMYGVPTKVLNQAVKRKISRFPEDFMFGLTKIEKEGLVTNCDRFLLLRHSSVLPYAFTQEGVAMLSGILNSDRAIQVNIAIMRAFVRMREILLDHKDLAAKVEALELKYRGHSEKLTEYGTHIAAIFEAIKQLISSPVDSEKPKIGFHP